MIEKTTSVLWEGPGKKGMVQISTETGAFERYPYGFASRFEVNRIALTLNATVPGIDEARFQAIALVAKRDCPLSKAPASVAEISLQATLETAAA